MAITINVQSSDGVNLNQGSASYLATLPSTFDSSKNLGFFKDSLQDAPQYGVAEKRDGAGGQYTEGTALLAGGTLSYSMQSHLVEGKLRTLALGEGLDGAPANGYLTEETMSVRAPVVSVSKLGLDSAKGDKVGDILYGMMTGDEALFVKLLAKSAVKFNGGDGDDSYKGGSRNDVLTGAGGADALTGGGGRDQFVFKSVDDSTSDAFDTIADFNGAKGDRINLKAIDADTTRSGNQAFSFIGTGDFSREAGELRIEKSGNTVDILGDVDGDGKADIVIHLATAPSLSDGHFIL